MSSPAPGPVPPVGEPRIAYRWIDRQADFDDLVETLVAEPRYALDTEFHRERTYYPKLALVQVAWRSADGQELALIDPLAVDVTPFRRLFSTDVLCVIHAAQQDLDVLTHAVGSVPAKMFDTQLAAGFVGYGTPSLVSLLQGEIGVSPPKGDRLTDWLRRPLTDSQRQYAAVDVEYLLEVHERLVAQLAEIGRLGWADDACEELRTRPTSGSAPDDAWLRLKDARSLRPNARAVAQSIAAWRERRAMRTDVPVRQVLLISQSSASRSVLRRRPRSCRRPAGSMTDTRGAVSPRRSSRPCAPPRACRHRRRRHRSMISTGTCVPPSRWCRHGWANWPATSASTRRCWRLAPTSWRSCAVTRTLAWVPGGATNWSVTASGDWWAVRPA